MLAAPASHAADLALKRVMLSSAGVGYFEFAADVDGPAALGLDVPLSQVDDVLKSLVVFDDAGAVGGIELPGLDSSHSAFGDVPFGPDALGSPLAFLNSLQGVDVIVQGPRPMTGRILQAEIVHATGPDKDATSDRTRVSVLTADGLKQFVLEDSEAVQIADPDLRARVDRALAALRQQSGQESRHITIRMTGAGRRTIHAGYVAVAPLWKASYRLVLPTPGAGPATARLQGWATLENASGTDWRDVALALQWGNPVTFHQAIYRSYFVDRPEVPVTVLGRLLPDIDTRARDSAEPPPPPAPAPLLQGQGFARASAPSLKAMAPAAETAAASEGTEETVFAVAAPVTLAAGHSASVPILDSILPADRIAIGRQPDTHPVASLRLRNTGAESLPAGVLTLYDAQGPAPYAGDARLGGLPAGETRILSYAQDLRTNLEWHTATATTLAALKAANGTLTLDQRIRQTTGVDLIGPAAEPRQILLEIPKTPNATVAKDFAQPAEETAAAWRFAVDLKPGEHRHIAIAIDQMRRQSFSLLNDPASIVTVLNLQGASGAARAALDHIAGLRTQETARATERDAVTTQRQAIEKDEERLRANLAAIPTADALHARLVRQLDADETRIGQLDAQVAAANQAVAKAHQALVDAIGALSL